MVDGLDNTLEAFLRLMRGESQGKWSSGTEFWLIWKGGIVRRERLSRERIVDSALARADAEGLSSVTIRRLAQDQGVSPMALYWHFSRRAGRPGAGHRRTAGDRRVEPVRG